MTRSHVSMNIPKTGSHEYESWKCFDGPGVVLTLCNANYLSIMGQKCWFHGDHHRQNSL